MVKSDVFAIGMILLEVCSLSPSENCYNKPEYKIFEKVI
jgi:hypothetical protein